LPIDLAVSDDMAAFQIALCNQHIDCRKWRRRRSRRRRIVMAARKHGRDPAGGEGDTKNDETRGFHYASLPT
jgi:hypothetical protein